MSDRRDRGRDTSADDALRERFDRLRAEEAGRAPAFERTWARAREGSGPRRSGSAPLWILGAAGAAIMAGLLVRRPSAGPQPPSGVPSLGDWRAPTDFLLQTPGRELLSTLPALGSDLPLSPVPAPERSTPS